MLRDEHHRYFCLHFRRSQGKAPRRTARRAHGFGRRTDGLSYDPAVAITGATPCLWFDDDALEAATFYVGTFPGSRITRITHYREGAPKPAGSILTVEFELFGRPFIALDGGPQFPHSEAVSFEVLCDTQEELDQIWDAITDGGGEESMCGWCRDRFGVSWQVVPRRLIELLDHDDAGTADRVWAAMMTMQRIDLAAIEAAAGDEGDARR